MAPENEVSTMPHAIRYGVVGGLLCVVVSVILYIADLQFESWARWVGSLIMVITIILGLRSIKLEHPGQEIGFGSLLSAGMVITAIITIITIGYFFMYVFIIDPDFISSVMEISRQKMEEQGMSEAQIEKALEISAKIMTPGLMGGIAAFTTALLGGIASLIAAAIYKQEK